MSLSRRRTMRWQQAASGIRDGKKKRKSRHKVPRRCSTAGSVTDLLQSIVDAREVAARRDSNMEVPYSEGASSRRRESSATDAMLAEKVEHRYSQQNGRSKSTVCGIGTLSALSMLQDLKEEAERSTKGVTLISANELTFLFQHFVAETDYSKIEEQISKLEVEGLDAAVKKYFMEEYSELATATISKEKKKGTKSFARGLRARFNVNMFLKRSQSASTKSGMKESAKEQRHRRLTGTVSETAEYDDSLEARGLKDFRTLFGDSSLEGSNGLIETIDSVNRWDVDVFSLEESAIGALGSICISIGLREDLLRRNGITVVVFSTFLRYVEDGYYNLPYHNSMHAADVTHSLYYMLQCPGDLRSTRAKELGISEEKALRDETEAPFWIKLEAHVQLAAILAAAVHDLGHPGVNNNFLKASWHDIALEFNDVAPLEMFHVSNAFDIIAKKRNCNVLIGMDYTQQVEVRRLMISMVLATNNANHASGLGNIRSKIASGLDPSEANRDLILGQVLHAADISNPSKTWNHYQNWTGRIMSEFFDQADQERDLGLPVMFDRNKIELESFQCGFIQALCLPIFETLGKIPGLALELPLRQLRVNLAEWEKRREYKAVAKAAAKTAAKMKTAQLQSKSTAPPAPPLVMKARLASREKDKLMKVPCSPGRCKGWSDLFVPPPPPLLDSTLQRRRTTENLQRSNHTFVGQNFRRNKHRSKSQQNISTSLLRRLRSGFSVNLPQRFRQRDK
eukprot:g4845.t1